MRADCPLYLNGKAEIVRIPETWLIIIIDQCLFAFQLQVHVFFPYLCESRAVR